MGNGRRALVGALVVTAVAGLAACTTGPPVEPLVPGNTLAPTPAPVDRPWPMHLIDGRYRGSNAVGLGDVNGDGQDDIVSNYEFDQRYVISFHPPAGSDPRRAWPTVDLLSNSMGDNRFSDTENAALGDFDGDGNLDVVGAQGGHITPFWEGYEPGIRMIWGPSKDRVTDATAWSDAGRFPATVDAGHFLWVQARDVNGDGATDIVYGGRVLFTNQAKGAIRWLEAPADPARRRDLSAWVSHAIDPDQWDGHGFQFGDVDGDGNPDLVEANADFDTPEADETVVWYRNPGPGTEAQRGPWPRTEIDRDPAFDAKPGLALADLDGDGRLDVLTQTADDVYWYRQTGATPPAFQKVVIPKDPRARQFARPLRVADMNGDGRLDLVGALAHTDGTLPVDKAAVFWMEYTGPTPGTSNWVTHVIRNGSGRTMLLGAFGEKWDNMSLVDVDGDGRLDVVANVEEWWVNDGGEVAQWNWVTGAQSQSVVWFENTLDQPAPTTVESAGRAVIEPEDPTVAAGGTLVARSEVPGASQGRYLQAFRTLSPLLDPDSSPEERLGGYVSSSRPGSDRYDATLDGGDYTLWLRRYVPTSFGYAGGGTSADSIWMSVDGGAFAALDDSRPGAGPVPPPGSWQWVRVPGALPLAAGSHQFTLKVRESGYAVDQIVLAADPAWTPPAGPVGPA
jgi:hypothetical protein